MSTSSVHVIGDAAIATARRWAEACRTHPEPRATKLLAAALRHPEGLRFTLDFVDTVIRPEDPTVAAAALRELARRDVGFLPAPLRLGLRTAVAATPGTLLPLVRKVFEMLVGDLVVDVGSSLAPALRRLRRRGAELNVNLLGEAVLGDEHARARLEATTRLLSRADVDYVSIKVSSVLGQHAPWGQAAVADAAVERLRPLFLRAVREDTFVNIDMEEYRDLHLTLEVFERLVLEPELLRLRTGLAVQCYLVESPLVLRELDRIAAARIAAGGAPLKARLVKGANLAMERVQAELRGWANPAHATKEETDASYLRALGECLTPERAARVRIGVASHNIYTLAAAWELAKARGVTDAVDVEMLSGMGVPLQRVIQGEVGRLRLYVPVVPRAEYDSAISYLVRRLEENAAPENFMSGAASLGADAGFLDREEARFRAALSHVDDATPKEWATQVRPEHPGFANAVDTDPALLANQEWAESIRAGLPAPELGAATLAVARLDGEGAVDGVLARGVEAGTRWADVSPAERARLLRRLGDELESARADLIRIAADEVGKLIDQADVEVSEACDFARYYAGLAEERVDGVLRVPPRLVLVASPWNFPIAIPLGGVAAALAAGSAVILKPAPPARRVAAVLTEACLRAGFPEGVVQLAHVDDGPLGRALVEDSRVGLVVLTGAAETAELFRSWRPGLPLLAETSGKNALVITPSADLDLAAVDLVASAFGHAGQKCSAASLGILVGSVARSRRFLDQVCDAARSLVVAWPDDPLAEVGPLTEPPGEKLLRGLTTLEAGQRWLLKPERIDQRLWRPGVREGVLPGSEFHQVEYFGPVLGLMSAATLDEAIAWQNGTPYGLTAGLHSLDPSEVQTWLDRVEAGNVYVNRSITGAIVRRQPFGGWKRSAVGPGAKAGGPNYLLAFGRWEPDLDAAPDDAWLAAARASDEAALRSHFRRQDRTGLSAEINVLRYRPVPVTVRVEDAPVRDVLREAAAASTARAPATFSFRGEPAPEVRIALAGRRVVVAPDEEFDAAATGRVRHLGTRDLLADAGGSIDLTVYAGPSVLPGRVALLPYLREQSVSITNHRFGHPSRLTTSLAL
ncbi:MAG: bifunctional proline dehydrogenase/L-glutamate gamma-semialdehyde dehydrogenase [Tessaracoccus sp.]|uniref:bifunctional proline dehydrogenase/L-glutamate gamma-semialdehyde dehydrogenase n=1 Tax=Tessaracoccus sp. TaxID=1971211 RepID=UPI001EB7CFBA|nr:bifunctional proline dehydrogenase/L-glutamate gamma-semialdehyde dehydrogenase [Tessaracoccus sp.]MBK7820696.1 bifunctional proline dehydrogenase/L-glutamate gamma-semialdehyde dehydrogenase [Tessaracoccus sp.]